jgi:hypothetical protein
MISFICGILKSCSIQLQQVEGEEGRGMGRWEDWSMDVTLQLDKRNKQVDYRLTINLTKTENFECLHHKEMTMFTIRETLNTLY